MTHTVEPRAARSDELQAIQPEAALSAPLRSNTDASSSPGDHWDQSDPSDAGGVSFANVQFDDIIFEDSP
jgi:hypothetical protein